MIHASFSNRNPFKGAPSDELDHAWHTLFVNSNIRVSAEDLAKINRTSVPVTDVKGGYYAIPGEINDHISGSTANIRRCISSTSLSGKG
jgi:hypothetical protein